MTGLAIFAGFVLGILADRAFRKTDIDLQKENLKLRKENEVLWDRLQSEGKIQPLNNSRGKNAGG